jgi:hypothetical protein
MFVQCSLNVPQSSATCARQVSSTRRWCRSSYMCTRLLLLTERELIILFVERVLRRDVPTPAAVLFRDRFYDNVFVRRRGSDRGTDDTVGRKTKDWPKHKFKFDFKGAVCHFIIIIAMLMPAPMIFYISKSPIGTSSFCLQACLQV